MKVNLIENRIFVLFLLLIGNQLFAQVQFEAEANRTEIQVGEHIRLNYVLSFDADQNYSQFTLPKINDFKLVGKSSQSRSSNSFGNGKNRSYRQIIQTLVLVAEKAGKITLPAAQATVDGKIVKSNTVEVIVKKNSSKNQSKTAKNSYVFMRLELADKEVYPNQAVEGKVKIYARNFDALRRRSDLMVPGISNFSVKEIKNKNSRRNFEQQLLDGQVYVSEEVGSFLFYPQKSGDLEIPSFELNVAIPIDFFDEKIVKLQTDIASIKVKDLPKAPKNFEGAIGDFKFATHLLSNDFASNQAIDYEIELIGTGNLSSIDLPRISSDNKDLEIYKPKVKKYISQLQSGEKGKIKNSYVIVPQYGGNYELPQLKFTYFDPKKEEYVTIKTAEKTISVKGEKRPDPKVEKKPPNELEKTQGTQIAKTDSSENQLEKLAPLEDEEDEIRVSFEDDATDEISWGDHNNDEDSYLNWWWLLLLLPVLALLFWFLKRKKPSKSGVSTTPKQEKVNNRKEWNRSLKSLQKNISNNSLFLQQSERLLEDIGNSKELSDSSSNLITQWGTLKNQVQQLKYGAENNSDMTTIYASLEQLIERLIDAE